MVRYHKAKPYDFVGTVKRIRDLTNQQQLQIANASTGVSGLYNAMTLGPMPLPDGRTYTSTGVVTSSGLTGHIPLALTDTSTNSCTGTSFVNMTALWHIPAGEVVGAGTTFRLTAHGNGTEATGSSVNLSHQCVAYTQNCVNRTMTGSGNIVAGAAFSWKYIAEVTVLVAGASGTMQVNSLFNWSQGVGGSGFGSSNGTTCVTDAQYTSIDTTSTSIISLQMAWSSTSGSPTITCYKSLLEKLGPGP